MSLDNDQWSVMLAVIKGQEDPSASTVERPALAFKSAHLTQFVLDAFLDNVQQQILQHQASAFWDRLPADIQDSAICAVFPEALFPLYTFTMKQLEIAQCFAAAFGLQDGHSLSGVAHVRSFVVAGVLQLHKKRIARVVEVYFGGLFDCEKDDVMAQSFAVVCSQLTTIGVLDDWEALIFGVLLRVIETRVQVYAQEWDEPQLESAIDWLESEVLSWRFDLIRSSALLVWRDRLRFAMYQSFASLRIAELFDLIVRFPDESRPAVLDLRACLEQTGDYKKVARVLSSSFASRLLQPGANTPDIIDTYVSTFHCLALLDTSGVTFEVVSGPICEYLSGRKNTIRCIVQSLTDPNSDLFAELSNADADDDPRSDALAWKPAPMDASSSKEMSSHSSIVSMLVSIYGGSEPFVAEYKTLLSDRLLQITDYNIETDTQTLELLKLKFGEGSLHDCDIMLRDMSESKRIDKTVHSGEQEGGRDASFVHATILSNLFWPKRNGDAISDVPTFVKEYLDNYAHNFVLHKPTRTLKWDYSQGSVDIDVQLGDQESRSFTGLSVCLASIILQFSERSEWTLEDLGASLGAEVQLLKRRISFWTNTGIIAETLPGVYAVMRRGFSDANADGDPMEMSDEEGSDSEGDEMLETFLEHMLTNLGALSAERVHESLTSFTGGMYDMSVPQLKSFLQKLVKSGKLALEGGEYSLNQNPQ